MGCSRTKFGLALRHRALLIASLRIPRGTSSRSHASMSCSRDKSLQLACTRAPQLVRSREPKKMHYGPPTRARTRATARFSCRWLEKGKKSLPHPLPREAAQPRTRAEGGMIAFRPTGLIHRSTMIGGKPWKPRDTHERIIRLPEGEPEFWHDRIEGLGWGFMYNAFIPINVTLVREFCANFSANHQETVFLRGRRIPFTENDIRHYLNINIDLPGPG
ncbi:hypothetical protein PIB30_055000 [Stylosanthes scabra]|uniref:Uncharacterized protein n=1 Tax=Stylosanthes scabra TaxID=79078 RepID=A0ABU6YI82_9FABA|nr:hypothetical protein [Stylosanthes scabra]